MEIYGFIYKITNNINNKKYIGKAKDVEKRFARHLAESAKYENDSYAIHNAIRKYGADNFSVETIDQAYSLEELNEKEKYWINFFKTFDKNFGYNIALGGNGGDIFHSFAIEKQEQIIKKGIATKNLKQNTNKGRTCWNNGQHCVYTFEKPDGDEWVKGGLPKPDVSKKLKGRSSPTKGMQLSDETKAKIGKASKQRCEEKHPTKGKKAYNNGKIFIYLADNEPIPDGFVPGKGNLVNNNIKKKKMHCITTNKYYKDINEAAKDTGFSKYTLWALCSKRLLKYDNTEWEYVEDNDNK